MVVNVPTEKRCTTFDIPKPLKSNIDIPNYYTPDPATTSVPLGSPPTKMGDPLPDSLQPSTPVLSPVIETVIVQLQNRVSELEKLLSEEKGEWNIVTVLESDANEWRSRAKLFERVVEEMRNWEAAAEKNDGRTLDRIMEVIQRDPKQPPEF